MNDQILVKEESIESLLGRVIVASKELVRIFFLSAKQRMTISVVLFVTGFFVALIGVDVIALAIRDVIMTDAPLERRVWMTFVWGAAILGGAFGFCVAGTQALRRIFK